MNKARASDRSKAGVLIVLGVAGCTVDDAQEPSGWVGELLMVKVDGAVVSTRAISSSRLGMSLCSGGGEGGLVPGACGLSGLPFGVKVDTGIEDADAEWIEDERSSWEQISAAGDVEMVWVEEMSSVPIFRYIGRGGERERERQGVADGEWRGKGASQGMDKWAMKQSVEKREDGRREGGRKVEWMDGMEWMAVKELGEWERVASWAQRNECLNIHQFKKSALLSLSIVLALSCFGSV